jgi:hypothetical protein
MTVVGRFAKGYHGHVKPGEFTADLAPRRVAVDAIAASVAATNDYDVLAVGVGVIAVCQLRVERGLGVQLRHAMRCLIMDILAHERPRT